MSTIALNEVRKSFGAAEVIHGIDLQIADGEFLALVGPSGCGKSTLLRMLAGLEDITTGQVQINGRLVNDLSPRERNVAMVFQSYALYPHMSVKQNMSFNLRLARTSKDEIERRVTEAARMLGLEELLDRRPANLSGGQRQRVAMGRAVVRDPAVFLFDEPLSNLDAKLRVQMRAEIKALHQKVGTTSVYVTHDQIEAMTLADRIVVLNGGRIEQVGRPLDLYQRPENVFVAGFIGSPAMNFLTAEVTGADRPVARIADGTELPLPRGTAATAGQEVTIGIRPEDLSMGGGALTGEINLVEPTGAQTLVSFSNGALNDSIVVVMDGAVEARVGAPAAVSVETEKVHVFDRTSGARL